MEGPSGGGAPGRSPFSGWSPKTSLPPSRAAPRARMLLLHFSLMQKKLFPCAPRAEIILFYMDFPFSCLFLVFCTQWAGPRCLLCGLLLPGPCLEIAFIGLDRPSSKEIKIIFCLFVLFALQPLQLRSNNFILKGSTVMKVCSIYY